mgnify:CR=1 FL=1
MVHNAGGKTFCAYVKALKGEAVSAERIARFGHRRKGNNLSNTEEMILHEADARLRAAKPRLEEQTQRETRLLGIRPRRERIRCAVADKGHHLPSPGSIRIF